MPQIGLQFRYGGRTYRSALRGLSAFAASLGDDVERLTPTVRRELDKFMRAIIEAMRQRHSGPWPSGTSPAGVRPGTLSRRGRGIASSLGFSVSGSALDDVEAAIFGSRIARVHERGAVIEAKRAKYLTVPLPAALDDKGRPLRRSARQWRNTFVKRSKRGNLIIFQKRAGNQLVPLYVLRKSVTIPPRLGLADTARDAAFIFEQEVIEAMLRDIQEGAP